MTDALVPKVLVIGGGPGGYVAAIRSGQLGLDTVLVESGRLGGTCLTRGCIPSKALIHAAGLFEDMSLAASAEGRFGIRVAEKPVIDMTKTVAWKETVVDRLSKGVAGLLRKAKVRVVNGWATFSDAKTCTVETGDGRVSIKSENVILATGSRAVELPALPFGDRVMSSTEALSLPEVPRQLVVVGAGYIGLELGIAYAKLGARVTIVEAQERILPLYDLQLTSPIDRWLKGHGVKIYAGAKALGLDGDKLLIQTSEGESLRLSNDRVLVTVGRIPLTEGWGLEAMNLKRNDHFIAVDDRCATATAGVWAIGDVVGEPMLAQRRRPKGRWLPRSSPGSVAASIRPGFQRYALPSPKSSPSA